MGIVSSAKSNSGVAIYPIRIVSIPDGDSFLREGATSLCLLRLSTVSIPDGDSFLREGFGDVRRTDPRAVSIPDGDSFLREAPRASMTSVRRRSFQSPMGIVSSAKTNEPKTRFVTSKISIPDGDSFRREGNAIYGHSSIR